MRAMQLTRISWKGTTFVDHQTQLQLWMMEARGYANERDTQIDVVLVQDYDSTIVTFVAEAGKYWSLLFVEYCILIGKTSVAEMKAEAEQFFISIWNTGHGGFVGALEEARGVFAQYRFEEDQEIDDE